MNEDEELLEPTENQDEDFDLSGRKKIDFIPKDSDIDGLYRYYQKGMLLIQPNYQRKYVWDAKKASLLIESILMNIPIPIVYLAATQDEKINVIDGQQRLTSIFSFIDGKFPDGKVFKLTGLKVLTELKGKTFKDLKEEGLCVVYNNYDELFGSLEKEIDISEDYINSFVKANSWDNFAKFVFDKLYS